MRRFKETEFFRLQAMSKWKLHIAEAAPFAIAVTFLVVIAVNPHTSQPKTASSFGHLIKEYFHRDTLTQHNIANLLEQILQTPLRQSVDDIPLPDLGDPPPSRVHIKTIVDLKINYLDGSRIDKGNLQDQLAAMRKHGFEERERKIPLFFVLCFSLF